jgi:hypothetical protein
MSARSGLQVADVAAEVELELAGGPQAALARLGHPFECGRPPQGPAERRLRVLKLGLVGQTGLIQNRLGGCQRLAIEGQDASHEPGDEAVEFGVGDGAVDPAIFLR